jgi:hypothetical protein
MHPEDATARGIGARRADRGLQRRGSFRAWAEISEAAAVGTATLPRVVAA